MPTQLTNFIYTDFAVSYRDALDRFRVQIYPRSLRITAEFWGMGW